LKVSTILLMASLLTPVIACQNCSLTAAGAAAAAEAGFDAAAPELDAAPDAGAAAGAEAAGEAALLATGVAGDVTPATWQADNSRAIDIRTGALILVKMSSPS
jgi:hypothetical protein